MQNLPEQKLTLGWREWVGLPELGVERIKAKVDTGARTSAIHAEDIRLYTEDGQRRVEFVVQPLQRNTEKLVTCRADLVDERVVTDSGGHKEERLVIRTALTIGEYGWPIEITLTLRHDMLFNMLLGRKAMENLAVVDPGESYLVGKRPRKRKT